MDLSTVQGKFESGMYSSRLDFFADVKLIIENCYQYNSPNSPVFKSGQAFEKLFDAGEFDKIFLNRLGDVFSLDEKRSHCSDLSIC
jgi:hypothetical protein